MTGNALSPRVMVVPGLGPGIRPGDQARPHVGLGLGSSRPSAAKCTNATTVSKTERRIPTNRRDDESGS